MEWGRVKTILILSFLFLNLLLAYQLWENRLDFFSLVSTGEEDELMDLLRSKNIEISHDIPKETPNVREISITYRKQMSSSERIELFPSIDVNVDEETWRAQLQKQIPELDEYEIDDAVSKSDELLVMNQFVNDLPLFQVNIMLDVVDQKFVRYSQNYVEVTSLIEQEEQPALSAYRVLRLLAESKMKSGSVIKDISLGYHGQLFEGDTQVLAPKWRVMLQNGDLYYVHAISGEVE